MEPTNNSRPILKYVLISAVIILLVIAFIIGFNYRSNVTQNTQLTIQNSPTLVSNDRFELGSSAKYYWYDYLIGEPDIIYIYN